MDDGQRRSLRRAFVNGPAVGRLICPDIPGEFTFLQSELTESLQAATPRHRPA
ncbi:MAG: hypothetical protein ACRD1U_14210 [Vicinamibacterales bacterium]